MVATASRLLRQGLSPSVSEIAEVAGVSRSTAYRYFPTREAMLRAVVGEALGPILRWTPGPGDAEARLTSLYHSAFPRLAEHEATFRATLRQSLEAPDGPPAVPDRSLGRGHRRDLLARAVGRAPLPPAQARRLHQALSLTFGIEPIIVLKDIWGLGDAEVADVALWAAQAMLRAARQEATDSGGQS
jgi:AcrR family transcriptional regulator